MLLRLQKYNLELRYKKGCDMFLADTLSRAYLPEVNTSELTQELEGVDHKLLLPVCEARWQHIEHASADDPLLQELRLMTQRGWPANRSDVPPCLLPYFDIRDELVVQGMIVFKGHQLVVPAALRKEMMAATHNSHIGIEACICRACESLYWPRMTVELKEYIQHCDVCLAHRNEQGKEPLAQHDFAARPWSKVTADLCQLEGRTLLVISDYYSNFIKVAHVSNHSAKHNQRVESSIRKISDPRHPCYRQRASVRLIRVLRLRMHMGVQARDIVSDLCSVEWKGGERRENGEAPV
ncbi:uncharacterized protein [Montipora foliosa]|uniref:uncharacterized protein n=1 Tax=Montipora foliosa TaxID=591990 RepID=UPI0035F11AB3